MTKPDQIALTFDDFVRQLEAAKLRSGKSYRKLRLDTGIPHATLHGWITGKHVPYAREREQFRALLDHIGLGPDAEPFLRAADEFRDRRSQPTANPYQGSRPFEASDATMFFGRERETAALLAEVDRRFADGSDLPLVVLGDSGGGKSSLLHAGLENHFLENSELEVWACRPDAVAETIERFTYGHGLLIVDQYEEVLSLEVPGIEATGAVTTLLREFSSRKDSLVVLGLQTSAIERASECDWISAGLAGGSFNVGPMTTEGIARAAVLPAKLAGITIEPELLALLHRDFAVHRIQEFGDTPVPLVSHMLFVLAGHCEGDAIGAQDYNDVGRLPGALKQLAEATFGSLSGIDVEVACELFKHLVCLDDAGVPTRRMAARAEVAEAGTQYAGWDEIISAFTKSRILRTSENHVVLTHAATIEAWPLLKELVAERKALMEAARLIRLARVAWEAGNKDASMLLSGQALSTAETVSSNPSEISSLLDPSDEAFLRSSTQASVGR